MKKTFEYFGEPAVSEYRERVALGALLMDKHMPGWADKIDLERLNLASTEECVLGQCFTEPRTVERWQFEGFKSLDDAIKVYPHTPADLLRETYCTANFDLGADVLYQEFGADWNSEEDMMVAHGFDETAAWDGHWTLLELCWEQEVKDRQTVVPDTVEALVQHIA